MVSFVPREATRILDIGCARGGFGELLMSERDGLEVWGVEPEAAASAVAARVLHHVFNGLFDEKSPLPEGYFDAIIFNDSLEHFVDHLTGLRAAHRVLRSGGVLIASIPNIRYWPQVQSYLLDADWKYEAAGVLDRTHLRFFTKRSIPREMALGGFEVTTIQGINPCWIGAKFKLLRALWRSRVEDMQFQQFAVVARKREASDL
jgi:SAM-dependent methyltransferase